jgi:kynurenine formamidase
MTDWSGKLPSYDELPPAHLGGRSAWGMFGADDSIGLVNLQTPERVVAAARLIRRGALFPLDAPADVFDPPMALTRGTPRHRLLHQPGRMTYDDVYDNFYPQAASQWDALCHCGYAPNEFYNGATDGDIQAGRRNTIDFWARRGIAGRAVLLDLPRMVAEQGRGYDPGTRFTFTVDDLEAARRRAGIEYSVGDVLVLHTGFGAFYRGLDPGQRSAHRESRRAPGLEASEDMCRYLWDAHVCAVATDTFAVEASPTNIAGAPMQMLHRILIGLFGMALGECWWTEDLAADCAADGVAEFFLTSMPMNGRGAGSPPHALAIK